MTLDDQQLVEEVLAGDRAQFGVLYDRYIDAIYRFVFYKTNHRQTAEDLTSQIFFKALEKIGSFRSTKGTFRTWLYEIARNTIIDFYRRERPTQPLSAIQELGGDTTKYDVDNTLLLDRVRRSMIDLTTAERDTITLRLWESLSHREIAEVLGKSEVAVKKMYSRAMKKLKMDFYEE